MTRIRKPGIQDLRILCPCAEFGNPMILVAARRESLFRNESADYRCPNCGRGRRVIRVTHPVFGERIRFRRI